jgi:hypothetical protein
MSGGDQHLERHQLRCGGQGTDHGRRALAIKQIAINGTPAP